MFVANILFAKSCEDLPISITYKIPNTTIKPKITSLPFLLSKVPTISSVPTISAIPTISSVPTMSVIPTMSAIPTSVPSAPVPSQTSQPIQTPEISQVVEYNFKSDDIKNIMDKHNDERQLNNLTDMIWNNNLRMSSQIWSNELAKMGCVLEHKLFSSAQNLYAGYGWTEPDMSRAVQMWIDEKYILNKPNVTFNEIGHYLIIVSNTLTEVGCASSININNNCFVVTCNYN